MKNLIILLVVMLALPMYGQNIQDALRLSTQNYYSTARTAGVGGAYGAIGADFGSISYNPAALASYRSGEFSIGFSSNRTKSEAVLEADEIIIGKEKTNRNLKLENAGLVFHSQPGGSMWSTSNFSFGLNRVANFNQNVRYKGETSGSFTDRFLERANGNDLDGLDNFEGGLAYDVGAIFGPDTELFYTSDYQSTPHNLLSKSQDITSTGSIYEMLFAYGANYKERLMFGLSVGIPFVSYNEDKFYREESIDDNSVLKKLEYDEHLSTSGVGINVKAGIIAKLNKMFRIGASVHTPSYYTLQDDYYTEMLYEYDEGSGLQSNLDGSPDGSFKYKFSSPWRYTGSVGAIFKLGDMNLFVDFDAEYADYSSGAFNFTAYSTALGDERNEKNQNESIRLQFRPAVTYRLGGELAIKKIRFRLGYINPGSPFERDQIADVVPGYSFGLGYRAWSYFVDFAYLNQGSKFGYSPYELVDYELEQFVTVDQNKAKWMLTFGKKF